LLNSLREVVKVNLAFDGTTVDVELAGRSIATLTW